MRSLKTNFVLVDVDDAEIDVGTLIPHDHKLRRALERAHGDDYVFRRARSRVARLLSEP